MDRTTTIIKYLEEYKHHCYIRGSRARNSSEEEYYRTRYRDIAKIVKELQEYGCRRTRQ